MGVLSDRLNKTLGNAPTNAPSAVLIPEASKDIPAPVQLSHDEARRVIALYRRHDPKSSLALIPLHDLSNWCILRYADGDHIAFNTDWEPLHG